MTDWIESILTELLLGPVHYVFKQYRQLHKNQALNKEHCCILEYPIKMVVSLLGTTQMVCHNSVIVHKKVASFATVPCIRQEQLAHC
jgi:hypothetical protein